MFDCSCNAICNFLININVLIQDLFRFNDMDIMSGDCCLKFNWCDWSLQFINEPFRLFKLRNVFTNTKDVEKLRQELDRLIFSHKVTDIFSFSQTKDLFSVVDENEIMLSRFLQFLQFFRLFLANKFNIIFDDKISASGSKYSLGDYLLCHDDKTEDRCIAFVYYLNSSWDPSWGGSLDIFNHDEKNLPADIRFSFYPEFNSMVFFEVGNLTYHQVSEVLSRSGHRVTINGWFHARKALLLKSLSYPQSALSFLETHNRGTSSYFRNLVNKEFFEEKYTELITEGIHENGVMMLQHFLKPNFFDAVSNELYSDIFWIHQGPAIVRKYLVADLVTLPSKTKRFITYFQSKIFCSYLESISGYKFFHKMKESEYTYLMTVEIQSWQSGSYSLLIHNDPTYKCATIDVLLFFNVFNETSKQLNMNTATVAGNIYYCEKGATSVKYEIEPSNNSICLVHKKKNETSFVPYISLSSKLKFHVIRVSYKL